MTKNKHTWNFTSIGGLNRVILESANDLLHLDQLDQKLWTALSCPVSDLEIDQKTLTLLDKDNDGHIRVPEVILAVKWMTNLLHNPADLLKQENALPLSAINNQTDEGKALLASAKIILSNLNKADALTLSAEDTSNMSKIFADSKFNGDGIITVKSTDNSELIILIEEILKHIGSKVDRGELPGIDESLVNTFLENSTAYKQWFDLSVANKEEILAFGENTEKAYAAYAKVKSKIDDYFLRCKLAEYDTNTTESLNVMLANVQSVTSKNLSDCISEIEAYPLAKIEGNKALPLNKGLNPAWENAMTALNTHVIKNMGLSSESLQEKDWRSIHEKFKAFIDWQTKKKGNAVETLGIERITQILNSTQINDLLSLIKQDKALESEANSIIKVNQLVHYYKDLYTLLKNFVTFKDFYAKGQKAIFQAGTLYIDQRSCDLCIKVSDMPKHASMASFSDMYLIYCDCTSKSTNQKMTIVAALTNGDVDNLMVGRNALFYDRQGHDWDATVVKIIENPISIKQAFWSPYRKLSRFIEKQINKVAAAQDNKVNENFTKSVEDAPTKVPTEAPKVPVQPFDVGKFVGIFAAIGLALGAIGTALAAAIGGFMGLVWWKMPIAMLGIILLISGPAMVLAYLKLRRRNLAPLLDANGWAINAKAIVNIPFGNTLTLTAELPKGAKISYNDPYTKKKTPYFAYILFLSIITGIVLFLLWKYGYLHLNF